MPINHRDISLRQVREDDLPFLFRLFGDPTRFHLWLRSGRAEDEAGFYQSWSSWTSQPIAAKFLVEREGRSIGLVFDYDRSIEDGHTKVTALLAVDEVGRGSGSTATVLFLGWLFETLPLRKIYMQVYGFNAPVLGMLRKLDFVEEGVLQGNRYWNGAYWDLHHFALDRDDWPRVRGRVLHAAHEPHDASLIRTARCPIPSDPDTGLNRVSVS